jgi:molybdenum cofactor guanylyltransferase
MTNPGLLTEVSWFMKSSKSKAARWEICILAGGVSERMRQDKSRLRLGTRTMLGQIRAEAIKTGLKVRVIRKDRVRRCGPLGGIYTALKTTRADLALFLACDMPFISTELIEWLMRQRGARSETNAIFVTANRAVGFPFFIPRTALPAIQAQIESGAFSIQILARTLKAKVIKAPKAWRSQLSNVNTPNDWAQAKKIWKLRETTFACQRQSSLIH